MFCHQWILRHCAVGSANLHESPYLPCFRFRNIREDFFLLGRDTVSAAISRQCLIFTPVNMNTTASPTELLEADISGLQDVRQCHVSM